MAKSIIYIFTFLLIHNYLNFTTPQIYWKDGKLTEPLATLVETRDNVQASLKTLRNDHKRTLNPTPYKVNIILYIYWDFH